METELFEKTPKNGVKTPQKFLPKGFAGTGPNGSFFESPEWVDQAKPPGLTSQKSIVGKTNTKVCFRYV